MFGVENYDELEIAAYSRAVSATPMDPRDGNQVRVWTMGYWSGRMPITGYILTHAGAYRCQLSYTNDTGKFIEIHRGHCRGPRKYAERLAKALAVLPELAKFDGGEVSCQVFDGWGALVEGIVDGKRFSFSASNPDACEAGKSLNAMIDLIANAYYRADKD